MLYKYFPMDRTGFLSNRLIRFTQPGDFNDPFELHPSFDLLSKADIAALPLAPGGSTRILTPAALQAMFSAIQPGIKKQLSQHAGDAGAYMLDNNRMAQATFDAKFGILCLSETPDSLLMWAHYASNHRGFVVRFDEAHPFFSATTIDGQSLKLSKVEYSQERPVLSSSTINSPHLYYRKSPEWLYEREWRLIKSLGRAAVVVNPDAEYPVHLFEVPREAITGVILGQAIPQELRIELFDIIGKEFGHGSIFQTALSKETYALEIHPPLDGVVTQEMLNGKIHEAR